MIIDFHTHGKITSIFPFDEKGFKQKIEEAKNNGQWDAAKSPVITEEEIEKVSLLLKGYEPAYTHFQAMSLSVRKTYTRAYFDAKTESGRKKRLIWLTERLEKNLKPM